MLLGTMCKSGSNQIRYFLAGKNKQHMVNQLLFATISQPAPAHLGNSLILMARKGAAHFWEISDYLGLATGGESGLTRSSNWQTAGQCSARPHACRAQISRALLVLCAICVTWVWVKIEPPGYEPQVVLST